MGERAPREARPALGGRVVTVLAGAGVVLWIATTWSGVLADHPQIPAAPLYLAALAAAAWAGGLSAHLPSRASVLGRLVLGSSSGSGALGTLERFARSAPGEAPFHAPVLSFGLALAGAGVWLGYGPAYGLLMLAFAAGHLAHCLAEALFGEAGVRLLWPLSARTVGPVMPAAAPVAAVGGLAAVAYGLYKLGEPVYDRAASAGEVWQLMWAGSPPEARTLALAAGGLVIGLALCRAVAPMAAAAVVRAGARSIERGSEPSGVVGFALEALGSASIEPSRAATLLRRREFRTLAARGELCLEIEVGHQVRAVVSGSSPQAVAQARTLFDAEYGGGECVLVDLTDEELVKLHNRRKAARMTISGSPGDGTVEVGEAVASKTSKGSNDPLSGALSRVRNAVDTAEYEYSAIQLALEAAPASELRRISRRVSELETKQRSRGHDRGRLPRWFKVALLIVSLGKARKILRRNQAGSSEAASAGLTDEERKELSRLRARKEEGLYRVYPRAMISCQAEREQDALAACGAFFESFERREALGTGAAFGAGPLRGGRSTERLYSELRMADPTREKGTGGGFLATGGELAAMWRPLGSEISVEGRAQRPTLVLAPPPHAPTEGVFVGHSNHPAHADRGIFIPSGDIPYHGVGVGVTGSGKSSFGLAAIRSAMEGTGGNGKKMGLCLMDPKEGSLFSEVLSHVPEKRLGDVMVVDVGGEEQVPGLNFLVPLPWLPIEAQAQVAVEGLENLWPSGFGANMRPLFVHAALAFLGANAARIAKGLPPCYSLLDCSETRFLAPRVEESKNEWQTPEFRERVLQELAEYGGFDEVIEYWRAKDAQKSANDQSKEFNPITNKISHISGPTMRRLLGTPDLALDPMKSLTEGRIVLFNLSQALLPADGHRLVGTLYLNLAVRAAQVRYERAVRQGSKAEAELSDFMCFLDEVQNFPCPHLEKILTEGRSHRFALWVAHQFHAQIEDKTLSQAFGNARTQAMFAATRDDATTAARFVGEPFTPELLHNMEQFNFVFMQPTRNIKMTGKTVPMPETDEQYAARVRECAAVNAGFSAGVQTEDSEPDSRAGANAAGDNNDAAGPSAETRASGVTTDPTDIAVGSGAHGYSGPDGAPKGPSGVESGEPRESGSRGAPLAEAATGSHTPAGRQPAPGAGQWISRRRSLRTVKGPAGSDTPGSGAGSSESSNAEPASRAPRTGGRYAHLRIVEGGAPADRAEVRSGQIRAGPADTDEPPGRGAGDGAGQDRKSGSGAGAPKRRFTAVERPAPEQSESYVEDDQQVQGGRQEGEEVDRKRPDTFDNAE